MPEIISRDTRVDWAAILAGAVVATAIGLILTTFGLGLGLAVNSPYEGEGAGPSLFAIGAGLWLLLTQVLAFWCGGYICARLRARQPELSEHEVDVRDGLHGLIVWGVGVLAQAASRERIDNPDAADETFTERRAEVARKLAVISTFVTAASLLVGAVAAFFAAGTGGDHRDKAATVRFFNLRRPMRGAVTPPRSPVA
jgi:hypothetical protein